MNYEEKQKLDQKKWVKWGIYGFVGFVAFCIFLGTFTIIPAGYRGVVLWWGKVENRIMGEGLNFKVPIAEKVIKMDVKVQPHPFKQIDSASKEYQEVNMTGIMNFHIQADKVNHLYQTIGKDFANKVIDPAFNDFVKEVTPNYYITEILPKREEIRRISMEKLQKNLERYGIVIDDIYFSNIGFSKGYTEAIEAKQVAQQQVETAKQILEQKKIAAMSAVVDAEGRAKAILVEATGQAKANDAIQASLTPKLVEYKAIEKWNGILPQVAGGAVPFINLDVKKEK
jgi:regulator of protease activity HflC (stomatin/prohibitin superfamily)